MTTLARSTIGEPADRILAAIDVASWPGDEAHPADVVRQADGPKAGSWAASARWQIDEETTAWHRATAEHLGAFAGDEGPRLVEYQQCGLEAGRVSRRPNYLLATPVDVVRDPSFGWIPRRAAEHSVEPTPSAQDIRGFERPDGHFTAVQRPERPPRPWVATTPNKHQHTDECDCRRSQPNHSRSVVAQLVAERPAMSHGE